MAEMTDIKKVLEALASRFSAQKEWHRRGLSIIRIIKTRTRTWRDVKGVMFRGYSEGHKKRRIELNLAVTPRGENTDSLMVMDHSDGMMQKVDHIVSRDQSSVIVDITDPVKKRIAYYHNIGGVAKKGQNLFEFWGLSAKETDELLLTEQSLVDNLLAELTDDLV